MRASMPTRYPLASLAVIACLGLTFGCSSGSSGNGGTGPNPTIAVALSPTAAPVVQGASTQVTATLSRGGGYTGSVTFTVQGAPAGVTGAISNISTAGSTTTATVTIQVDAATVVGTYTLTVRATGSGVTDATAAYSLTVTGIPSYTLSLTPSSISIAEGANSTVQVGITRANFTGTVNLTALNVPAGVEASFEPAAVAGNNSNLKLTVGTAVAVGQYAITVQGSDPSTGAPAAAGAGAAAGAVPTATLTLTVTSGASGSGNVTVDFSRCAAKASWLAAQDGSGPWTVVTAVGNMYHFTVNSGTAGVAFVIGGSGFSSVIVLYFTQAELTGSPLTPCPPVVAGATVFGTAVNIGAGNFAELSFGGQVAIAATDGLFQFGSPVAPGTYDLIGWLRSATSVSTNVRGFVNRGLTATIGTVGVGTVDFTGTHSFAPASGTATISNALGGETVVHGMGYFSGTGANACVMSVLYGAGTVTAGSFAAFGFPAANQMATDYHSMSLSASVSTQSVRTLLEDFHDFTSRMTQPFVLPTTLPVPAVAVASGGTPYKRLTATLSNLPPEYNGSAGLNYSDKTVSGTFMSVTGTAAWRGGSNLLLTVPDLSALPGWQNAWAPGSGGTVNWSVTAVGTSGVPCQDGHRNVGAAQRGTI